MLNCSIHYLFTIAIVLVTFRKQICKLFKMFLEISKK